MHYKNKVGCLKNIQCLQLLKSWNAIALIILKWFMDIPICKCRKFWKQIFGITVNVLVKDNAVTLVKNHWLNSHSIIIHFHNVIPNLNDFLSSVEHKINIFCKKSKISLYVQKQLKHFSKYHVFVDERKSCRFRNDMRLSKQLQDCRFWVNYPFNWFINGVLGNFAQSQSIKWFLKWN